jgi:ABC-type polysaccharide/polyol phosphate transport system ATPase subunit
MSDSSPHEPCVVVDGVWKKFRRGEVHDSLRDLIPAIGKRLVGRGPRRDELGQGDFWALEDVSFTVRPGEVLGIIGANGAGKSTLLKTLTRILRPNRGYFRVQGRVGALIEVAAGFHPDLTGRENVFLQGAIMGMRAHEIRTRFDDIVEFAGIADAIDTPVKRYSSGMNARLGFSIAAHLDPDVLIIDEVLAVGDFEFQRRAFDRMRTLARSGMPVVVVSHQLERIADLCTKAILLERGRVAREGSAHECIEAYVGGAGQARASGATSDSPVVIDSLQVEGAPQFRSGEWVRLRIAGSVKDRVPDTLEPVAVRLRALHTGELVYATSSVHQKLQLPLRGEFVLATDLQLNVPPGNYALEIVVWDRRNNCEAFTGPIQRLEIDEGSSFWGHVQMNAAMKLMPAGTSRTGTKSVLDAAEPGSDAAVLGQAAARPVTSSLGS